MVLLISGSARGKLGERIYTHNMCSRGVICREKELERLVLAEKGSRSQPSTAYRIARARAGLFHKQRRP